MKRFTISLIVLPFLFVACASEFEIPVEEVRTCSNVVKVELVMRKYNYPGFALGSREGVEVKMTLENGKYVYNEPREYNKWWNKGGLWEYSKWWNKGGLLETATKMEMGQERCFTDYKPIK